MSDQDMLTLELLLDHTRLPHTWAGKHTADDTNTIIQHESCDCTVFSSRPDTKCKSGANHFLKSMETVDANHDLMWKQSTVWDMNQ